MSSDARGRVDLDKQAREDVKALVIVVGLACAPAAAFAQAAIAGTVRDSSGAVLPGVVVEASSPGLIEKTRTAVTDAAGQYRIDDLRRGTFSVGFVLAGWSSFQQDEVELTGTFTATVNARLAVGPLSETVTVTGSVPAVDVHGAGHELTLGADVDQIAAHGAQL